MENGQVEISPSSSKFVWRIENFSKLNSTKQHYSETFVVGGCKWRVMMIYPKECNENYLSLYLERDDDDSAKLTYAEFSLALVNQIFSKKTFKHDVERQFTAKGSWGFQPFLPLTEFNDPHKGYLVNDTCIVKVMVSTWRLLENSTHDSTKTESSAQAGVELQPRVVPVNVVTPITQKDLIKGSEPELDKELTKLDCKINEPAVAGQASQKLQLAEYPGAGQPFEGGWHHHEDDVLDKKFEDIGGFSVMKPQASLYKQIWLKYGHIASSQVPTASSYIGQVWLVADLMSSVMDMQQCCLCDVSAEMIDLWENKIKMAEKLEFNVRWLRERFEDVKKVFYGIQKFKTAVQEQGQPLRVAKKQVIVAEDELKKAQARLIVAKDEFRENISALVSESEINMYLEKSTSLLLDGMFQNC